MNNTEQVTVRVSKPGEVVEFDLKDAEVSLDWDLPALKDDLQYPPEATLATLSARGKAATIRVCLPMNRWPRIKIALQQLKEALFNA